MSDNSQANESTTISRRILVVEDNYDSAEVLQTFLEIYGHQITVHYDGKSALASAGQIVPEVIICDISLSDELDGYDVARRIRQNEQLSSVLLIALSGYGQKEAVEKSKAAGFDAHLVKPTNFDALLELINNFTRE